MRQFGPKGRLLNFAHENAQIRGIIMMKITIRGTFQIAVAGVLLAGAIQAAPKPPNLRGLESRQQNIGRAINDRDAALERIVEEFRRNRILRGEVGAFRGYSAVLRG